MPREMFSDVRQPSITVGSQTRFTVVMSMIVHAAIIAAAIVIPLVATDVLPAPRVVSVFIATPVPPPPPPPPPPSVNTVSTPAAQQDPSLAPVTPPSAITAEPTDRVATFETAGVINGAVPGVIDGLAGVVAEPAPPPPPPVTPTPVRPGGDIRPPVKVKDVRPAYPGIAQAARVQGVVILEATIGPDGAVQGARVLRSIPLLDQAALDAVRQWQFTPTLLNGVPVSVIMTVTVTFTLQ